ncbi:MAG: S8 family serine peptidase [Acidobacteriota bacterium]|nr:S8 family serine peptidase [Acidobacteriota bacterium]
MILRRAVLFAVLVAVTGPLMAVERERSTPSNHVTVDPPVVVRGTVETVRPPFGLVLADGTEVSVDPDTDWSGVMGVEELQPGDEVLVAGRQKADTNVRVVTAGGVRVISGARRVVPEGSPVCLPSISGKSLDSILGVRGTVGASLLVSRPAVTLKAEDEVEGVVVTLASDRFELETESEERYTIAVVESTEFRGLEGLGALVVGDTVRCRGELTGTVLTATRVELRGTGGGGDDGGGDDGGGGNSGSGGGVDFESVGVLVELQPPDRFVLSDQRSYVVDGLTVFDDPLVSYAGLTVGQYLEVKAVYEGASVYRTVKIEYQGDRANGEGYVKLEGTVDAISASDLTLSDGNTVLLTSTTVFNGDADRYEDVLPGWKTKIYALRGLAGDLIALSIRCEDLRPSTTAGQEFEPMEAVLILAEGADSATVADRYEATISGEVSAGSVLFSWEREIDDELLASLEADPDVEAVEPNFLFRDPESVRRRFIIVDRTPTREEYTGQAAAVRHGFEKAQSVADGSGAVVAIMDTGVDRCHPLLVGHLVGGGLDLVDGDISPWETMNGLDEDNDGEVDEAVGHGTFVASLVALAAPGAKILPYRVLDDDGGGTAFNLALALADAIDRRVDVINLSLAYHKRSVVVDLLLEEAERRGVVVVAAAGNNGASTLPFPAIDSHVLAVTALKADGAGLADFANRGDKAVVAAVGEEVYGGLFGGEYGASSGTSLAAPFAAAGAALAKGLDPGVSADIVRLLLIQSGVPVADGSWSGRSLDLGRAVVSIQP